MRFSGLTVRLWAAAVAVGSVTCRAPAKEARMDEAVFGKTERMHVGRFSLEVPAGARRYGETYELRELTLSETELKGSREEAWKAAWAAKLAAVRALEAKRLDPTDFQGKVQGRAALETGFELLTYCHENMEDFVTYAGLRDAGGRGLWLSRIGELGEATTIRAAILLVGKAYLPRPAGAPPAKGDVFHLPHGAVALPFHDQEKAKAVFQGGPLDVEVKLSTESTPEPEGGGLMTRFGEAVAKAGAAFAAGASPVRNRGRTAAGMKGEEFVMRDSEGGKLYFMWEFKGEANSGARPEIQLQMITKDDRQKEKMAYWDALVDSLRPAAAP